MIISIFELPKAKADQYEIMKKIKLLPSVTDIKAEVGDELAYVYYEHISVGYMADFDIEDESVVRHKGSETIYEQPERMNEPGITGADAAQTTIYFEAMVKGTTLLIIRNLFRMDIESEYRFRITVY